MLVRVDHHRVARPDGPPRRLVQPGRTVLPGQQGEEPAVGRVHVHPHPVPPGHREHLVHRVDGAQAGGARGGHHRADPAAGQQRVQLADRDAAGGVHADRRAGHAEHAAHPAVGVVRLGRVGDAPAWVQLAGHVQRLQVGDRATGGQVTQGIVKPEHGRQPGHGFLLHLGGGRAAVQGVVVRVDQHGGEVAGHGGGMRRLEHLADIAGVEERVIVPQPPGEFGEHGGEPVVGDVQRGVPVEGAEAVLPAGHRLQSRAQPPIQVHVPSSA